MLSIQAQRWGQRRVILNQRVQYQQQKIYSAHNRTAINQAKLKPTSNLTHKNLLKISAPPHSTSAKNSRKLNSLSANPPTRTSTSSTSAFITIALPTLVKHLRLPRRPLKLKIQRLKEWQVGSKVTFRRNWRNLNRGIYMLVILFSHREVLKGNSIHRGVSLNL